VARLAHRLSASDKTPPLSSIHRLSGFDRARSFTRVSGQLDRPRATLTFCVPVSRWQSVKSLQLRVLTYGFCFENKAAVLNDFVIDLESIENRVEAV
jgi:hypothetical protein